MHYPSVNTDTFLKGGEIKKLIVLPIKADKGSTNKKIIGGKNVRKNVTKTYRIRKGFYTY